MTRPKGSKNRNKEIVSNIITGLRPEIKYSILFNKLMVDIYQTQKDYNISVMDIRLVLKKINKEVLI